MAKVRNQLRRDFGFSPPPHPKRKFGIDCVYSTSNYVTRVKMAVCLMLSRAIRGVNMNCATGFGASMMGHRKLWLVRCCHNC